MRSIFNFISFPGIADSGGHSDKVPSFSIDYLQVENVREGRNGSGKKMKNLKILEKNIFSNFSLILKQIHKKNVEFQIKIDFSDS